MLIAADLPRVNARPERLKLSIGSNSSDCSNALSPCNAARSRPGHAVFQNSPSGASCPASNRATSSAVEHEGSDSSRVRVAVRARPLNPSEEAAGAATCVLVDEAAACITVGMDRKFSFDHVYGPSSTQDQVYNDIVSPLVTKCLNGYNACVFAYGQTGSGKTHTMGTANTAHMDSCELGLVPRAVKALFDGVNSRKGTVRCVVRVQFLEIYNEEIRDLLHPEVRGKDIQVRETPDGEIVIYGAMDEVAEDDKHALHLLELGMVNRTVGSTRMNQQSSRSHAIFSLHLEQQMRRQMDGPQGPEEVESDYITAKFHMVDLAGSERSKKTGAEGARFKEAVNINQGLLCLGNVISALSDDKKRKQHVPYRDSKLTRMLQDSLGGNSKTVMIACISSADINMEESINTLKYAMRAKTIQNRAVVNHAKNSLAALQAEVSALQLALLQRFIDNPDPTVHPMLLFGDLSEFVHNPELLAKLRLLKEGKITPEEVMRWDPQNAGTTKPRNSSATEEELKALKAQVDAAEAHAKAADTKLSSVKSKLGTTESRLMGSQAKLQAAETRLKNAQTELEALRGKLRAMESEKRIMENQKQGVQSRLAELKGQMLSWVSTLESLQCEGAIPQDLREKMATVLDGLHRMLRQEPLSAVELLSQTTAQMPSLAEVLSGRPQGAEEGDAAADWRKRVVTLMHRGTNTEMSPGPATLMQQVTRLEDVLQNKEAEFAFKVGGLERQLHEREKRLAEFTIELQDAKEDLARDEVIFEDKVKEIERLRARNKELQKEVSGIKEHQVELEALLHQYQQRLAQHEEEDNERAAGATALTDAGAQTVTVQQREQGVGVQLSDEEDDDDDDEGIEHSEDGETGAILDPAVLEERLEELQSHILLKEGLIKQLAQNEREARRLSRQYLERMKELEELIDDKEGEVELLRQDLENVEGDMQKTAEEKNRMRAGYEWKINKLQGQMDLLKTQLQEQQTAKVEKERHKAQSKIQMLEADLTRMRMQYDKSAAKLKSIHKQHTKANEVATRQMLQLRRAADEKDKKMRDLEVELQKQKNMVKRKHEEATLLQRKLSTITREPAIKLSTSNKHLRRPSVTRPVSVVQSPTTTTTLVRGKKRTFHTRIPTMLRISLDKDIEKLLAQREAAEKLEVLKRKLSDTLSARDVKVAELSQLELKRIKEAQTVEGLKHELELGVQELQEALEEQLHLAEQGDQRAIAEVKALSQQLQTMEEQHAELTDKLQSQELLSETDEYALRDVEDRLDALRTEIEYIKASMAECEQVIIAAEAAEESMKARTNGDHNVHVIVQQCLSALLREREASRQEHGRVLQLETALRERENQLQLMEHAFKAKEADTARKLMCAEASHNKTLANMMAHTRAASEGSFQAQSTAGSTAHHTPATRSVDHTVLTAAMTAPEAAPHILSESIPPTTQVTTIPPAAASPSPGTSDMPPAGPVAVPHSNEEQPSRRSDSQASSISFARPQSTNQSDGDSPTAPGLSADASPQRKASQLRSCLQAPCSGVLSPLELHGQEQSDGSSDLTTVSPSSSANVRQLVVSYKQQLGGTPQEQQKKSKLLLAQEQYKSADTARGQYGGASGPADEDDLHLPSRVKSLKAAFEKLDSVPSKVQIHVSAGMLQA